MQKILLQDGDTDRPALESKPLVAAGDVSRSELLTALNLPKLELETFDGDPMTYHSFTAIFNEHVVNCELNPSIKLTRLLQYTSGKAKEAIRSCSIVGGEKGYDQACSILARGFGNDDLVSEMILKSIKTGKPVRSGGDLQHLADQLTNCLATLQSMNKLHEIDTQDCIRLIVSRLQRWIENRWKRLAHDMKKETGKYSSFEKFVEFICNEADYVNDPMYGDPGSQATMRDCKNSSSFSATTNVKSDNYRRPPCKACSEYHHLFYCPKFKNMKVNERIKFVKDQKTTPQINVGKQPGAMWRKVQAFHVEKNARSFFMSGSKCRHLLLDPFQKMYISN